MLGDRRIVIVLRAERFLKPARAAKATDEEETDDAEPSDLQRYIYQYRIGPTKAAIAALVAMLPQEQRSVWEGKMVDYLA